MSIDLSLATKSTKVLCLLRLKQIYGFGVVAGGLGAVVAGPAGRAPTGAGVVAFGAAAGAFGASAVGVVALIRLTSSSVTSLFLFQNTTLFCGFEISTTRV